MAVKLIYGFIILRLIYKNSVFCKKLAWFIYHENIKFLYKNALAFNKKTEYNFFIKFTQGAVLTKKLTQIFKDLRNFQS